MWVSPSDAGQVHVRELTLQGKSLAHWQGVWLARLREKLRGTDVRIVRQGESRLGGEPGRELVVDTRAPIEGKPVAVRIRYFLVPRPGEPPRAVVVVAQAYRLDGFDPGVVDGILASARWDSFSARQPRGGAPR